MVSSEHYPDLPCCLLLTHTAALAGSQKEQRSEEGSLWRLQPGRPGWLAR